MIESSKGTSRSGEVHTVGLHGISKSTLSRLPVYLEYLKSLPEGSPPNISATIIASALGLGEVQVRKDLASVSTAGKPKIGYIIRDLIAELESFLGYDNLNSALIVGVGKLGRALLEYDGFARYGIEIIAGFDQAASEEKGTKPVYPMSKLSAFCRENAVKIGVIAVPAPAAQQVCDQMVKSGILAILNFAPTHLVTPDHILVRNENIAVSLAMLSDHLAQQLQEK